MRVRWSYDALARPHRVAMMSQGCRHCDGVGSSWKSGFRHSGVSEVGQDQRLQRHGAYRVVGLLRSPRPQGKWCHRSGEAVSAHRVIGFTLQ
ncbi:hypothetical protein NDU88_002522 [Pleurodeles waltl]|uniref:Uncharacterized protein n=1 Tax=Pleurodeles waltl TaxID=8319 RepID=A0AAV7P6W5_PLEWA|nr:hypothetical protein NDU88_002522 [Pleurodeles waltl]